MKNQGFISEEYRKACRYCERGECSFDGSVVLCPKKGLMDPDEVCRKYVYDPLKRTPMQPKSPTSDFTAEDFSL
jgi:hypothetical protein